MSWAHSITTPCTCVNNTSCNQPKVVPEREIQAPIGKERQRRVGDIQAADSMVTPTVYACKAGYCRSVVGKLG